jgi:uncharacterized damage-inducible protein DinB
MGDTLKHVNRLKEALNSISKQWRDTMKIRILMFACALLVAVTISTQRTRSVSAQETDKAKTATALRKNFQQVSSWVTASADLVPPEKYNYKPVDTVRTFGQLIGHITDSYNYFCAHGVGNKVQWADPAEKGNTDKATLLPKLKEALDKCNAAYASDAGQMGPLMDNVGHTNLHYGNLITYIRMMGMKPPSS